MQNLQVALDNMTPSTLTTFNILVFAAFSLYSRIFGNRKVVKRLDQNAEDIKTHTSSPEQVAELTERVDGLTFGLASLQADIPKIITTSVTSALSQFTGGKKSQEQTSGENETTH